MNEEARNNVFRILLKYLNHGKKTFKFSEIDGATDDGVAITDLSDVVRKMTEDKILCRRGIEIYDIAVDIGAFRDYILKQTEIEREAGGERRKTSIEKIMDSSWTAVKPNKQTVHDCITDIKRAIKEEIVTFSDDDDDGLTDFDKAAFAHLDEWAKKRRQEIMQSMEDDAEDEDEDDDDDADSISAEYEDNKEIYMQALKFCVEHGIASVSLIQRRFPIGYIMSCKIIDWMEDNDFISPQIGSKPRRVLVDKKDFENIFGVPFDEKQTETKEPERDGVSGSYLKMRANEQDRKNAAQNLVNALSRVAEKKNAPVTCGEAPDWSLWNDEDFEEAVVERLERIIKSDRRMGRQGAIKKAETYLEAVRDTHDGKMVQVYERIVYEFKTASDYIYRQLKKQLFE